MANEVKSNREMGACVGKLLLVCNHTRSFTCWDNDIYREDIKSLTSETPKLIVNSKI